MNYWNILIILCFFILYMGLALVFGQLRGLRDDLARLTREVAASRDPVEEDEGEGAVDRGIVELQRRLQQLGVELLNAMDRLPKTMHDELDAIQGEIRLLGRSMTPMNMNLGMGAGRGAEVDEGNKTNAYREARLLLANNVDEERVIVETGLTVEEVSLLKRMANKSTDGGPTAG
ncbi:MAG: hypothetical protein HQL78_02395 [Magnetococcales bacterium]|nr:hypothetical protein [Magnetococcales bacterium]